MPGLFSKGGLFSKILRYHPLAIIGRSIAGPRSLSEDDERLNIDPEGLVMEQLRRLQDPQYGLAEFERLAAAATPSQADYLARLRASGGSALQATEQQQGAAARSQGRAFDAFRGFRLGALGAQNDLIAQQLGVNQFRQGALLSDRYYRQGRQDQLLNQGLNILGSFASGAATGGGGTRINTGSGAGGSAGGAGSNWQWGG